MKKITKIYFRDPIHPDLKGFAADNVVIYAETAEEFDPKTNCITINQGWTIKTGGEICRIEKPENPIRSFIFLEKILKIELTFEKRPQSPK